MDKKTIIFTLLIILGLFCLIILIDDCKDTQKEEEIKPTEKLNYSGTNLTYSYYNYTTGKVTNKTTNIQIFNKVFKD